MNMSDHRSVKDCAWTWISLGRSPTSSIVTWRKGDHNGAFVDSQLIHFVDEGSYLSNPFKLFD